MKQWFVYILGCNDGTLYIGITNNLEKRIKDHNSGKGAKYTRGRLPVTLKYVEIVDNKSQAAKNEYRLKQLSKKEKETLIFNFKADSKYL